VDTTDEVLSLLTEDYYGLWEIAVQVPVDREVLIAAICTLVDQGLAEWFVRHDDSAEAVRLAETDAVAPNLTDEGAWSAPLLEERQFLLGPTEAGKRAYFGN
jgi:hypothetical protein